MSTGIKQPKWLAVLLLVPMLTACVDGSSRRGGYYPSPERPRYDWNRPQRPDRPDRPDWNRPGRPDRPDWNRPGTPDRPDWNRPGRPDRSDWGRPDRDGGRGRDDSDRRRNWNDDCRPGPGRDCR